MDYWVVFERADDGSYSCYVPDLPGCVSSGDTLDEAKRMIEEAIGVYADVLRERGQPVPPPMAQAAIVHAA